MLLFSFSLL